MQVTKFEDIIDNFQTKDGDVFIATYVKAGTTWTQQIVHQLLRQGRHLMWFYFALKTFIPCYFVVG